MRRILSNALFLGMLLFVAPIFVFAEEAKALKMHELTGTVVSQDKRYKSACILDDKILWEGQTYVVRDGKIQYAITLSKRVKLKEGETIAKVVKVDNGEVQVEYQGETYVFKDKRHG